MKIYLFLVLLVIVLGHFLDQRSRGYLWVVTGLHILLCGLRHPQLTGDLMKYNWLFLNGTLWDGKNPGFSLFMGIISGISGGNFQILLLSISVTVQLAAAWIIRRYSRSPMVSFLAWNCLGFYIFGFSAIKQALTMGLLMLAFPGLTERNFRRFAVFVLLAGCVHRPALIFLPAWWLTELKFDRAMIVFYLLAGAVLWFFREPFAGWLMELYYGPGTELPQWSGLGGRFFLIAALTWAGILLRGMDDERFGILLHLMAVSALLQMLSGYGNLFTRLADNYFQFSILFLPEMLGSPRRSVWPLDEPARKWLTAALGIGLIIFYYAEILSVEITYPVDDYLNFRFFWQQEGLWN